MFKSTVIPRKSMLAMLNGFCNGYWRQGYILNQRNVNSIRKQ